MISAREANKKASNAKDVKKLREKVENELNKSIDNGFYHVGLVVSNYNSDVIQIVCDELISLGYDVVYEPAKPIPPGCPADQWHSSDYLKISWED